jgi:hypothetical protein
MSESDSSDYIRKSKRSQKIKKPKKAPKALPNELIVIKNQMKDKGDWVEKWTKDRSIGLLIHPMRLLALGGVGRGKTNTMKNIFLKHQTTKKPFKKLYIITCSSDNKEWNDCEPSDIFTSIPPMELFTENTKDKTMVIIDDFEMKKMNSETERLLTTLFRYVSSHCNVSLMCGYQSFFDASSLCRKCSNVFLVYKPNSRRECTDIENRVGLEKNVLKDLFRTVATEPYDSIMIDLTVGTPAKLRKNIYQKITYDSDSE